MKLSVPIWLKRLSRQPTTEAHAGAKRLECAELAPALRRYNSAGKPGKPGALQTLRAVHRAPRVLSALILLTTLLPHAPRLCAQGISEPSLVLYGVIRNAGDGNVRLTEGTLTWRFQIPGGGNPVAVSTALTNLNDQFSYVLRVPCETYIGSPITSNTLKLIASAISYDRSQVTVTDERTAPAALVPPALPTLIISSADRGRMERVDLTVSLPLVDTDGDGLPDSWEIAHGLDPFDPTDAGLDYDNDGLSNLAEYRAGTDPNDFQSAFAILDIQPDPAGGINLRWSSVAHRNYSVLRSVDLTDGFTAVQTNLPAAPPFNSWRDVPPAGSGPYFYRLSVER